MGKLLYLGQGLKYPITIRKLLKQPGDEVAKGEAILEYTYTGIQRIYDKFGDEKDEEQQRITGWDSPSEGKFKQWRIHEGDDVKRSMAFAEVDEYCSHDVQFAGLCAMCGKDMTQVSWASSTVDTERAKINMIHDQTHLKVSQNVASKAEEQLQQRLLTDRKLSLVVDLDQTIIHACIEPTVGEWQKDKNNPNYDAVKDVRSFQLKDDGPRGLASECWYYVKLRPGLKEFLAKIAEMYELHVYTMGTRAYATNIAKLVDPDKKLFGDRIISRDESGSMTAKSLARLFPVDTKMVCIIDDRADVWPNNRPNLIKVIPYDFFKGIGDINSSFLPKREEGPKAPPKKKLEKEKTTEEGEEKPEPPKPKDEEEKKTPDSKVIGNDDVGSESKVSALDELVKMGGGDDQKLHQEQAAEQEKTLEKQLTERPLLHKQEELDKEEEEGNGSETGETSSSKSTQEHHKQSVLQDDDDELHFLEEHLALLHKSFYDEYDAALPTAQSGRVAQLKAPNAKKMPLAKSVPERREIPDIGEVMPRLKSKVLRGKHILLSGMVPLGVDVKRSEIALQAQSFGAIIHSHVSKKLTHVIAPTSETLTQKVRQAAHFPHIKLVNQLWLVDSMSKWKRQDEAPYLMDIPDSHRTSKNHPSPSLHDSDESLYDSSRSSSSDDEHTTHSQETDGDYTDLLPDEDSAANSPVDLKTFDWSGADDELDEFLGESGDEETDRDEYESDASTSSHNIRRVSKAASTSSPKDSGGGAARQRERKKRKLEETEGHEGDNSEEESTLAKKQRVAGSRSTGLKDVNTVGLGRGVDVNGADKMLLTPGVTGDEEEGDHASGDRDAELEAEAEAEAEMERALEDELERELASEV